MFNIRATNILVLIYFILIYKNISFILFPNLIVKGLFIVPFLILTIILVKKVVKKKFRFDLFQSYLILVNLAFFALAIKSIFDRGPFTKLSYVLISLQQIYIPIIFFTCFSILAIDYKKLYAKIINFSIPIFVFSIVEIGMPQRVIEALDAKLQMAKFGVITDFQLGSYVFQDFGMYFIRSGSLFIEPLTLSIYSAVIYCTFASIGEKKSKKIMTLFSLVTSIGKSGFLIALTSLLSKVLKKKFFVLAFVLTVVCFYLYFKYLAVLNMNELKLVFATAGPHFYGLTSGIINATLHPFAGFGLGTGGYLIYQEFRSAGLEDYFFNSENIIPNNGNESFIGVLLYQTGYVFTGLYIGIYVFLSLKLAKYKEYLMMGMLLGCLGVSFLTESSLALLLMITPFSMAFTVLDLHNSRCSNDKNNR